jgi:hypothetical protein
MIVGGSQAVADRIDASAIAKREKRARSLGRQERGGRQEWGGFESIMI